MVLKMDQRCAYAAKPFVPDLISQSWIGLSSKASDRLWFRREDKNRVESQPATAGFFMSGENEPKPCCEMRVQLPIMTRL